ncbi:MAG TPA: DUF3592 domain-containing protein [Acidimicrobiales bacterium]|nr:DUF3592 domain-containing protein [Acidimicrobiales bacterium]
MGVGGAGADAATFSRLRGAGVDVDLRRLGRLAAALLVVAVLASSVGLFVAAVRHNRQADQLRTGVPVVGTVTRCLGLLGGSGSNSAGTSCSATYVVAGRRYTEGVPGTSARPVGSRVRLVFARGDPALVTTPDLARAERSSWQVFVLPAALLAAAAAVAALSLRRRGAGRA